MLTDKKGTPIASYRGKVPVKPQKDMGPIFERRIRDWIVWCTGIQRNTIRMHFTRKGLELTPENVRNYIAGTAGTKKR